MQHVRVVFPTAWDQRQLDRRSTGVIGDYDVSLELPTDADCSDDFDVLGYIDRAVAAWRGTTDGVCSSSDYPGAAAAAAIATGLGLPGSRPQDIMRAAHKGESRRVQRECAPEATPEFLVIDLDELHPERLEAAAAPAPLPGFVKPAKGCFSVLSRRVEDAAELVAFLRDPAVADYRTRYLAVYRDLASRWLGDGVDPTAFVCEAVLQGRMVTVEAFATGDATQTVGVVDAVRDPRTGSFIGFEYPSALPPAVQARMAALTERLGAAFGLRWTMYNVELMWDPPTDRLGVVEINPRMCGQFADLYEKVDGVHGHRIAFDLACGKVPALRRNSGAFRCAASYPLRVFQPVRVLHAPSDAELRAATAALPGALAWNEIATGDELIDFAAADDGQSYRYAVLNVGAGSRAELAERRDLFVGAAGYRFEPIGAPQQIA